VKKQEKIRKVMREFKEGSLKSSSGQKVKKPQQAMAIALSEASRMKAGGKVESRVNEAGNYTKPTMRKSLVESIKAGGKGGAPGQWSARKAQMVALQYKAKGGGYKD
jgi:hypothetical protein